MLFLVGADDKHVVSIFDLTDVSLILTVLKVEVVH